ncbi:plasmid mobilization protein [Streptacidiphilus cavernicola]|uniref:Plasmid mobilization relaxosome protein MobC n=1 Tax=Streptacidiphilus cavernicola TaxID=3342716 RepID=A0ABV6VVI7_9ACTN
MQTKKPISVRFSAAERQLLQERADASGLTLAHCIARWALADQQSVPVDSKAEQLDSAIDELAAIRTQIAAWGNNLNQVAHRLNTDGTFLETQAQEFLAAAPVLLAQARAATEQVDETVFRAARHRGRT